MNHLLDVPAHEDILPEYRDSPVGLLLKYHNLGRPWMNTLRLVC
jgi:carbonic anhydrase